MSHNIETVSYDVDWANLTVSGTGMANNGAIQGYSGDIQYSGAIQGYNGTSATDLWTASDTDSYSIYNTAASSGKLTLTGKNADIEINGESLNETLQAIKDALRIPGRIQRDEKMEESFEELRKARENYERMLEDYKAKMQTWDILNKE